MRETTRVIKSGRKVDLRYHIGRGQVVIRFGVMTITGRSSSRIVRYWGYFHRRARTALAWPVAPGGTTAAVPDTSTYHRRRQSSTYSSTTRATCGFARMLRTRRRRSGAARLGFSSIGEHSRSPTKAKQIGITWGRPRRSAVASRATRARRSSASGRATPCRATARPA